ELDRLIAGEGQRRRHPDPHVLLPLTLLAVDARASARVVRGVEGRPEGGEELIDEMSLHGVNGVLLEGISPEEVVVVGEERDGGNPLERQRAPSLGHSELRFDGPAVAPDVQELRRVVLTERSRHLQAGPYYEVLLVFGELFQRERGGSE